MELEDLKNSWRDITTQVKEQQHLSTKNIEHMTQTTYTSNLKKIAYPEIAGVIVCLMSIAYVAFNFSKLNTTVLQVTGIVSILLLSILSAISIVSLWQFNATVDLNKPYAETLKDFAVQKTRFHKLQKINILLSYLLLVATVILLSKFSNGKDITGNKYFWTFSITFGYIFLLFVSKWVSQYYSKTLRQTEDLLKELAS